LGVLDRLRDHGRRAREHARLLPAQALALSPRSSGAALAAYAAVSFVYFGLPVVSHFGSDWVGSGGDPQIFVWSLAWWPHAVLHWQNPVVTHAVWPPGGLDLTWVSSIPALAVVLAPVTLAAGPVAAYNVASIALPALGAWTAFLLCRHVTRAYWPSLAGGYLYGFSSYELGQLQGHLHMSSVVLLPLVALLVLRYVEGTLDARGLVLRLGPVLAVQFLLSTEILFTLTLALLVAAVVTFAFVAVARARVVALWRPLLGSYLLGATLVSPLLVYALLHFQRESLNEPGLFSADLLNIVSPTPLTAINLHWSRQAAMHFVGNTAENGAYLGLPLLTIVAWYAWQSRRRAGAWLLVSLLVLAVVAELGPNLRIRGATYAPLPWKPLVHLPFFNDVLPARFAVYAALAAAVIAASWAAGGAPLLARIVLVVAAVAATVPALGHGFWHGSPHRPAFFAHGVYRSCLEPNAIVLALPYPSVDAAMLWQAEARFRYRLADAWLSPVVPHGAPDPSILEALHDDELPPGGGSAVLELARDEAADAIVVDGAYADRWRPLLTAAGLRRRAVGGVEVYAVDGTLAPCRSRSGRRGASSTSSTRTSAPAASSASPRTSSCSRAARMASSCSTASRTPPAT
jgi:hypothetical protein